MHIDNDYTPGATIKSGCHNLQKTSKSKNVAGRLGTPGARCDAPVDLAQQTLDWIVREWRDKIDFVIWTGDNSRHDWDKKRRRKMKHVLDLNQQATDMMIDAFWPHVPIIPTLGNNDVFPHNQIGGKDQSSELLDFYEELWRAWIPQDQRETFRSGGYFAVNVSPGLRVLSLNSMYFYKKNELVQSCGHAKSPAYQHMQWYKNQLAKARQDKVRVYVIGHVPPSRDYRGTCLDDYLRISLRYADVIMGHFYGHLNMDHFLLYDGQKSRSVLTEEHTTDDDDDDDEEMHVTRNIEKYVDWLHDMYKSLDPLDKQAPPKAQAPILAIQVSPSVLPRFYPTVRIFQYEIDEDDIAQKPYGTLLGYSQYFSNITKWEDDLSPIDYMLEYTTQDAYGMEDLSPASYLELAKRMVKDVDVDGNEIWARYVRNMFVQTENDTFA
ncbi:Endopolyphosphatase [Apophysomyces sp. BC1034]|nr:Endopolyphosphatase [Apophysomyces sp. BC1015]KAG0181792.1 Endopolyphosphatase [Apophysomyces sp. BC1021]KAG0193241.1 Endopolyphosphatase [Apophysomyces sp. BC1034]